MIYFNNIIILLVFLCLLPSETSFADDTGCKCFNALNTLSDKIQNKHPEIKTNAIKGYAGFALMQGPTDMKTCKPSNNISNLIHCPSVGIDQKTIDIFLKIYHGIISEEAATEIPKCYSAFFYFANQYENKYGKKTGEKLGYIFGVMVGSVSKTLAETFPKIDLSYEAITKNALYEYEKFSKTPPETRKSIIEEYCLYCEKYEVPIKTLIKAAWINAD